MSSFRSKFAPAVEAMLEYRIALGLSAKTPGAQLKRFDRYCVEHCPENDTITKGLVFDWLNNVLEAGSENISGYTTAIRNLAEYMNAIGQPAYVLPTGFYPFKSRFAAFVFSDAELSALFGAMDSMPRVSKNNEAKIAPVLFRLIYTCGLRPNEGRELLRNNINLDSGEIKIVNTKKKKDRLVVMSPDMLRLCRELDRALPPERMHFFIQTSGKAYTASQVDSLIKKCWNNANPGVENLPNIRTYDLRHRFASACLNRWLDEGADLNNKLIYLMAYMGHNHIDETRYYVRILPENLVKSASIDWNALNSVIPEVTRWRR